MTGSIHARGGCQVSVITTTYNAEPYVEQCIRSVLAQSFEDWEHIVVDDGSSDRTLEIVRSFQDPRIRVLPLEHRGLGALAETFNAGLAMARGNLIGVLDGDDAWLPHKLTTQVPAFEDPSVMLSWGRALIIDENNRVTRRWRTPRASRHDLTLPELFRFLARWNVLSPAMTVVLRRTALERIHGFQQNGSSLLVDLPTWLMLCGSVPGRARYFDQDLGLYRIHNSNTGLVHNSTMRIEHLTITMETLRRLGAQRLQQLGWTARDDRITQASTQLSRGIAFFQQGQNDQARSAFVTALRLTHSPREYLVSLTGLTSALTGIDLIDFLQRARTSAAAIGLRLSSR
jgi:hypothetical protein